MVSCRKFELAVLLWPLTLAWLASASRSVRADEIVAVTDEHGQKVYINTGDYPPGPTPRTVPALPVRSIFSTPVSAGTPSLDDLIHQTASRYRVDPQLVSAIVRVESEGDARAVSIKGAKGLMQLIPATAQRFGVQDPYDPRQNVEGGVSYLRYLLDLFGGDVSLALAGYNAGEHSVEQSGGIPPYRETQAYVRKVSELYTSGSERHQGAQAKPVSRPTVAPIYRYVDDQGVVHYTNE
jgi:soluble lytic murein transglycosylase-like protein